MALHLKLRKLLKILAGLFLIFIVAVGLVSKNHPIILKWLSGSARIIGKPISASVYTDGHINNGIKVFHIIQHWGSNNKANNYLLSLTEMDSRGRMTYLNINFDENWIGIPVGSSEKDYDFIAGYLFQSETGGRFALFQDDMKGFDFDPHLTFTEKQIKFNLPPDKFKFDSVRIEL